MKKKLVPFGVTLLVLFLLAGYGGAVSPPQCAETLSHASNTLAFGLGNNDGLPHTNCGGPEHSNPDYPHKNASLGVYGHKYEKPLDERRSSSRTDTLKKRPEEVLFVSGSMDNGKLELDPAYTVTTQPSMPDQPGPYTLEGYNGNNKLFSISFKGKLIARERNAGGSRSFAFSIPTDRFNINKLDKLKLTGRGGTAKQVSKVAAKGSGNAEEVPVVNAKRVSSNTVSVSWDDSRYKYIMVENLSNGQTIGWGRKGSIDLPTDASVLKLYFSDGVRTATKRVEVQ